MHKGLRVKLSERGLEDCVEVLWVLVEFMRLVRLRGLGGYRAQGPGRKVAEAEGFGLRRSLFCG